MDHVGIMSQCEKVLKLWDGLSPSMQYELKRARVSKEVHSWCHIVHEAELIELAGFEKDSSPRFAPKQSDCHRNDGQYFNKQDKNGCFRQRYHNSSTCARKVSQFGMHHGPRQPYQDHLHPEIQPVLIIWFTAPRMTIRVARVDLRLTMTVHPKPPELPKNLIQMEIVINVGNQATLPEIAPEQWPTWYICTSLPDLESVSDSDVEVDDIPDLQDVSDSEYGDDDMFDSLLTFDMDLLESDLWPQCSDSDMEEEDGIGVVRAKENHSAPESIPRYQAEYLNMPEASDNRMICILDLLRNIGCDVSVETAIQPGFTPGELWNEIGHLLETTPRNKLARPIPFILAIEVPGYSSRDNYSVHIDPGGSSQFIIADEGRDFETRISVNLLIRPQFDLPTWYRKHLENVANELLQCLQGPVKCEFLPQLSFGTPTDEFELKLDQLVGFSDHYLHLLFGNLSWEERNG
ncbi:hypothetical protein F5876DRAFT_70220 [Lentinula aff. lateritia]|uniref:Uncharacterized protein n=1 Tax=Lentinula aff. lateritia TaxID=2804960 RepID=A0ACC1TJL7_9AGAR|nr:hypothetical protein F5876DRAFT_70220 [Lentinula aff. lateritia]